MPAKKAPLTKKAKSLKKEAQEKVFAVKKEKTDKREKKQIDSFAHNDQEGMRDYYSDDDGSEGGGDNEEKDGFADMMAKILAQKVDSGVVSRK